MNFTQAGIITARAIQQRLYDETWLSERYDLLPRLQQLDIPTPVLHGDYDFIPVEIADRIAQSLLRARLAVLQDWGHFSFIECPGQVHKKLVDYFADSDRLLDDS